MHLPPLHQIAPWTAWLLGSGALAADPFFGSTLYVAAALWLFVSLLRLPKPTDSKRLVLRILTFALLAAPPVAIAALLIPRMTDVAVIIIPFYLAPVAAGVVLALIGILATGLRRPSKG